MCIRAAFNGLTASKVLITISYINIIVLKGRRCIRMCWLVSTSFFFVVMALSEGIAQFFDAVKFVAKFLAIDRKTH